MKTLTKIAAATTVLAASLISTAAMAEAVTNSVDAYAGLAPALEMSCTPVSFGVWRVPVRAGGAVTTVTLDAAVNSVTPAGNLGRVAQSTANAAWIHNRGVCTMSGSTAADATNATTSIASATAMPFSAAAAAATGYTGLNAAATAAALVATLTVGASSAITGGATTFYVGGVLSIPATIVVDNYGGYKTTTAATVTADDGI
jgi:hypothetical protein